jgi:hypothetical protein
MYVLAGELLRCLTLCIWVHWCIGAFPPPQNTHRRLLPAVGHTARVVHLLSPPTKPLLHKPWEIHVRAAGWRSGWERETVKEGIWATTCTMTCKRWGTDFTLGSRMMGPCSSSSPGRIVQVLLHFFSSLSSSSSSSSKLLRRPRSLHTDPAALGPQLQDLKG